MAIAPIFPVLLVAVVARCKSDYVGGFTHSGNSADQFGPLLKPPPPPLAPILPVPFHSERTQRHNADVGYQYQTPPPPPLPSSEFKFPAPFYKQYSFNFVPPPQPFTTTPSPTMFQKVSEWLFPSQQTNAAGSPVFNNNIEPIKKDCNPCNLVPWLPVIRYNLGAKQIIQNPSPTYGAPSPTAYADFLKTVQSRPPQPFNTQHQEKPVQLSPAVPHAVYGPPTSTFFAGSVSLTSPTYGPPSATHTLDVASPNPITSTFSQPSSSYGVPSSSFVPSNPHDSQFLTQGHYKDRSPTYTTNSPYISSVSAYQTPHPLTTTFQPQQNDVEFIDSFTPKTQLQLPQISYPTVFRNSYGEPINDTKIFDISYPVSATAAESTKVKTHVLPHDSISPAPLNSPQSFALANPSPFSPNRGRNIHTLQPVALPNLSVSPLPPIFNARPFRPMPPKFPANVLQGINQMQQFTNNVNVEQSVPIAEYTHSVDYPATVIQSPIIEINVPSNQTKGYRNIPNSYVVDEIRDISSQASEDHISATKSDSSFESTGIDVGNELYDTGIPSDLKPSSKIPINHKTHFADLRGINDDDLDKYRTESNLQNIDSPLLYLKPSAPHKSHGNFVLAISSPIPNNEHEYEIYDDIPTTTQSPRWEASKTDYEEQPSAQGNAYKPKIVQIIVPYTTGNLGEDVVNDGIMKMTQNWPSTTKDEFVARKVPTTNDISRLTTEIYSNVNTVTTEDTLKDTENYDMDFLSSVDTQKDLYDVKEAPFDIIKLQHTIDDWTEQEYSKQYKTAQKTRSSEKYAKQIPDDYFTTSVPTNYVTTTVDYNYDVYDHEGSSSIQHTITDQSNNTYYRPQKEYNTIERTKTKYNIVKNEEKNDAQKLHIYTAASSFRTTTTTTTTTTTPAPWGKIQTSISPLTKEKVYVVTSKPWSESSNASKHWYEAFDSKKTNGDSSYMNRNVPIHTPRFLDRPSFGFTSGGKIEADSSYGYSKKWYQSINELQRRDGNNSTAALETTSEDIENEERESRNSNFDQR